MASLAQIHLFACLLACACCLGCGPSLASPVAQATGTAAIATVSSQEPKLAATGQADTPATIPLVQIMPKLEAIHEDTQNLLIKNNELKAAILLGLHSQLEAKLKAAREAKLRQSAAAGGQPKPISSASPSQSSQSSPVVPKLADGIDFSELEEFNKWVDGNLEYAVKNTEATIEALKEEAQHNNGYVEYTEQAVKDGIEGVKYWQQAVIFQDKTLKNEKFSLD